MMRSLRATTPGEPIQARLELCVPRFSITHPPARGLSNERGFFLISCSSSEEESESEEGVDDSTCPPGCDSALFQQACAMREQRLDLEELIGEGRRALEQQRRDLEGMRKKARSMEAHVKTALSDLQVRLNTQDRKYIME